MQFVRYEAALPNARGAYPGVFALANGLARDGLLTPADHALWRRANDWYEQACPDPGAAVPGLFARSLRVTCWFKADAPGAAVLLERVGGHLDLLDRYRVPWVRRRSSNPGVVLYEDDVQVVVGATG